MNYRICIVVPCWRRPARTRRMLANILAQNINNWEAFVIGDGCPDFNTLFDSGEAKFYQNLAESKGNKLHMFNFEKNYGGYGYQAINFALQNNSSNYIVFGGNDDIIHPAHFEHYLSEIENTDYDMVAYKTCLKFVPPAYSVRPIGFTTESDPLNCMPGHAEIIVKSSTARMFLTTPEYGHDWKFVQSIYKLGKSKIANSLCYTYFVTHTSVPPIDPNIPIINETID